MFLTRKKWIVVNSLLFVLLAVTVLVAVDTGAEKINIMAAVKGLNPTDSAILFSSRLPRVLLAMLVGLALASSGGAFQALLKNPLADPFILGISGGAALGSTLAVGLHLNFGFVPAVAFISSLASMFLIFALARTKGHLPAHTLLLTGVIFNAFCFALILFINSVVTMEQAYQIIFLLIGNLEAVDFWTIGIVALFILVGFFSLIILSGRMNMLSLGDEATKELGINTYRLRISIFVASSLMVGAAVSVSGLIGFVGLFIPHAVRLIFGSDHRLLITASGLLGGAFLVASDTLARTLLINTGYGTELPVGVITALIGAPCFAYLLKRKQ